MVGTAVQAQAATKFPAGLIYTKDALGRWAGKEGAHLPQVTVQGKNIKKVTPHPMTKEHFIVKHTLVTTAGKVLGDKTFANTDPAASPLTSCPKDSRVSSGPRVFVISMTSGLQNLRFKAFIRCLSV